MINNVGPFDNQNQLMFVNKNKPKKNTLIFALRDSVISNLLKDEHQIFLKKAVKINVRKKFATT